VETHSYHLHPKSSNSLLDSLSPNQAATLLQIS